MKKFELWIEDGDRRINDFDECSESEFVGWLLETVSKHILSSGELSGSIYDLGGNKTGRYCQVEEK